MRVFATAAVALIVFFVSLTAQGVEYLQKGDVNRIMDELFAKHIDKKEMTEDLFKHALVLYVNQFDPRRIYLLQEEVQPFLNPTPQELQGYMAQYKQKNLAPFIRMDQVIRQAIARAQKARKEVMTEKESLFAKKGQYEEAVDFAKTPQDLQKRIQNDLLVFIDGQKDRFGKSAVDKRQDYILEMYDNDQEEWENGYLYVDSDGKPLSPKEGEHQFTLHILKALAKSMDNHTNVFDTSEAYDIRMRLLKGYPGTGIVFVQGIQGITVSKIMPDSPAAKSGKIESDDLLVKINGHDVSRYSFHEIMKMFEGEKGEKITIVFKKQSGKQYEVTLTREMIMVDEDRVEIASVPFEDGIIGRITLHSFYQGDNGISSEKDVRDGIDKLRKQGKLKALVLDLRDNSGGYLSQAVKVAGLFITNGVVAISKYHNGDQAYYRDVDGKTYYDGPLVVLISRITASAAEIVAQALKDYGVAVIVGDDRSYGKGSIQSQTVTQGGDQSSLFKVTVGKYYTVSGKTPQKTGVQADVVVPSEYVFEEIGEQYTQGALEPDAIEPAYTDSLADIRPEARPWYLRYYLPTLQPKKTSWQLMIPELRNRSTERMSAEGIVAQKGVSAEQQVDEAFKVAEDMIRIHSTMNADQIGSYN